jgi:hypothetical protein
VRVGMNLYFSSRIVSSASPSSTRLRRGLHTPIAVYPLALAMRTLARSALAMLPTTAHLPHECVIHGLGVQGGAPRRLVRPPHISTAGLVPCAQTTAVRRNLGRRKNGCAGIGRTATLVGGRLGRRIGKSGRRAVGLYEHVDVGNGWRERIEGGGRRLLARTVSVRPPGSQKFPISRTELANSAFFALESAAASTQGYSGGVVGRMWEDDDAEEREGGEMAAGEMAEGARDWNLLSLAGQTVSLGVVACYD